jgi:hypothetical protein
VTCDDLDPASVAQWLRDADKRRPQPVRPDNIEALQARLAGFAAQLPPCPPPDIAGGFDLCPCGTGSVWPCRRTRAAWVVRGLDRQTEVRRGLDAAIGATPPVEEHGW